MCLEPSRWYTILRSYLSSKMPLLPYSRRRAQTGEIRSRWSDLLQLASVRQEGREDYEDPAGRSRLEGEMPCLEAAEAYPPRKQGSQCSRKGLRCHIVGPKEWVKIRPGWLDGKPEKPKKRVIEIITCS